MSGSGEHASGEAANNNIEPSEVMVVDDTDAEVAVAHPNGGAIAAESAIGDGEVAAAGARVWCSFLPEYV